MKNSFTEWQPKAFLQSKFSADASQHSTFPNMGSNSEFSKLGFRLPMCEKLFEKRL